MSLDTFPNEPEIEGMRTGRPTTFPGLLGTLAAQEGGPSALAEKLDTNRRSLWNWATNARTMDAVVAAKAGEMLIRAELPVYEDPEMATDSWFIGCAPEGWVTWAPEAGGWAHRKRWEGDPATLVPGNLQRARRHGWPY